MWPPVGRCYFDAIDLFKMKQAIKSAFRKAGGVKKEREPDKGTGDLTQKNSFAAKHLVDRQGMSFAMSEQF